MQGGYAIMDLGTRRLVQFIDNLKMLYHVHIGDIRSLAITATTTHSQLDDAALQGVTPGYKTVYRYRTPIIINKQA